MLGAIIGDIVGSRFEFNNQKTKDFTFFTPDCFVTDDSILTLAVAEAIMATSIRSDSETPLDEKLLEALTVKHMQDIGRRYPDSGYGGMFFQWLFSDEPRPYNSFGNGAAMRVSPAGFAARTEQEAIGLSGAVTRVTHNHPEGIKGAEAVGVAIFLARQGAVKEEIRKRMEADYYSLDFTLDEIRDSYRFDETCQGTVPQALQAFLEGEDYVDAVRCAVSIGGDSDTLAAIAGGIAQAAHGIPKELEEQALQYLDKDLTDIYERWQQFMADRSG